MILGAIGVYPVKSLRGGLHHEAVVGARGLAEDRHWMVVDPAGRFLTQREHPAMATVGAVPVAGGVRLSGPRGNALEVAYPRDGATVEVCVWRDRVRARLASDAAASFLTQALGAECRLVWMEDPRARDVDPAFAPAGSVVGFADGFPLLLTNAASLADLNARLALPIGMERFRANVVVEGAEAWAEDRWRRVRIGAVAFGVAKPCTRCVITTIDQRTGERPDPREPLRTLARFRRGAAGGVVFGQNLVPEGIGTIRTGDPVVRLA